MPDPVKKKKKEKKKNKLGVIEIVKRNIKERRSRKKKAAGTAAAMRKIQTGYGPQNRLGTFVKKKKVTTTGPKKKPIAKKGPKKKPAQKRPGDGATKRYEERQKQRRAAIKKAKIAKMKAPQKRNGGGKPMSVSQLRKKGKIQF